jgi:hypothetical protein
MKIGLGIFLALLLLARMQLAEPIPISTRSMLLDKPNGNAIGRIEAGVPVDTIRVNKDFMQVRIIGYFAWKSLSQSGQLYDRPDGDVIATVQRQAVTVLDSTRDIARAEVFGWILKRALLGEAAPVANEALQSQPFSAQAQPENEALQSQLPQVKACAGSDNGIRCALPWAIGGVSLIATGIVSIMTSNDWKDVADNFQKQIDAAEYVGWPDSYIASVRDAKNHADSRRSKYAFVAYSCFVGGGAMLIVALVQVNRAAGKPASSVSFVPVVAPYYGGTCLLVRF